MSITFTYGQHEFERTAASEANVNLPGLDDIGDYLPSSSTEEVETLRSNLRQVSESNTDGSMIVRINNLDDHSLFLLTLIDSNYKQKTEDAEQTQSPLIEPLTLRIRHRPEMLLEITEYIYKKGLGMSPREYADDCYQADNEIIQNTIITFKNILDSSRPIPNLKTLLRFANSKDTLLAYYIGRNSGLYFNEINNVLEISHNPSSSFRLLDFRREGNHIDSYVIKELLYQEAINDLPIKLQQEIFKISILHIFEEILLQGLISLLIELDSWPDTRSELVHIIKLRITSLQKDPHQQTDQNKLNTLKKVLSLVRRDVIQKGTMFSLN
jgi:hypothetical protein